MTGMAELPPLAPAEREAVVKLLRGTIAADPYPLSPRIRLLKSALAKLDSAASPASTEPHPQPAWREFRPAPPSRIARRGLSAAALGVHLRPLHRAFHPPNTAEMRG